MLSTLLPTISQQFSMTGESTKQIGHFYLIFLQLAPLQKAGIDSDTITWPQTSSADSFIGHLLSVSYGSLYQALLGAGSVKRNQAWLFGRRKKHVGRGLLENNAAVC